MPTDQQPPPVEQSEQYTCRLGTLRRGDRFTTKQGPYFLRADGSRTSAAEKGPLTFQRYCRQGPREWIEAYGPNGFALINLGATYRWEVEPSLVRRAYKLRRIVSRVSHSPGDDQMAMTSKKTVKKTPAKKAPAKASKAKARKPPAKKAASKPAAKKLSALDAAAQVLGASKEPLTTKQMIEAMAAQVLWTSPGGKTPWATLYSALLREIAAKGKDARFVKTERGKFAAKR